MFANRSFKFFHIVINILIPPTPKSPFVSLLSWNDVGNYSFTRFERLRSERTASNEEHLEAIRHMTLQNESVAATFKV